jgi:hypothetical protein
MFIREREREREREDRLGPQLIFEAAIKSHLSSSGNIESRTSRPC